jgi:hypothetical protein
MIVLLLLLFLLLLSIITTIDSLFLSIIIKKTIVIIINIIIIITLKIIIINNKPTNLAKGIKAIVVGARAGDFGVEFRRGVCQQKKKESQCPRIISMYTDK